MKRARFSHPALLSIALSLGGCRCRGGGADLQDVSKESPSALHLQSLDALEAPVSRTAEALPIEGIPIYVTRTQVLLGDDRTEIVPLGDAGSLAKEGIERKYKPAETHYVVILADAITALRKKKGLGEWTPAAVVMDASLPYAVLQDVLVTLQRLRFERYALIVKNEQGAPAAIQLSFAPRGLPPMGKPLTEASASGSSAPTIAPDAPIYLGVRFDDDGYALRAFGREVGAGCAPGPGITVPKHDGTFDDAGLTACAMQKKALAPNSTDDAVALTAPASVDYRSIVRALDALRRTPDGKPLFPAASFTIVH